MTLIPAALQREIISITPFFGGSCMLMNPIKVKPANSKFASEEYVVINRNDFGYKADESLN